MISFRKKKIIRKKECEGMCAWLQQIGMFERMDLKIAKSLIKINLGYEKFVKRLDVVTL